MKMYDMVLWLTRRGNVIISGLSVLFTFSFLTAPKRMILKDPLEKRSDRKLHILVTQCHKISGGKPQGSGSTSVWRDSSPVRQ